VQALFGLKAGQTLEWDDGNGVQKWTIASVRYE
jgi:transcription elongation GreA/GreB family factor